MTGCALAGEHSIKILSWARKTISQRKNGIEFSKVGREWGESGLTKKKRANLELANSTNLLWYPWRDSNARHTD
jgi:hypothetical protein